MIPEQIYKKYKHNIEATMEHIRGVLLRQFEYDFDVSISEVYEETDDQYQWSIFVDHDDDNQDNVKIDFYIAESEYWDGEENGVNFMIDITSSSGRILGNIVPHNYTNNVWVNRDDPDAIDERFTELTQNIDYDSIAKAIAEGFGGAEK